MSQRLITAIVHIPNSYTDPATARLNPPNIALIHSTSSGPCRTLPWSPSNTPQRLFSLCRHSHLSSHIFMISSNSSCQTSVVLLSSFLFRRKPSIHVMWCLHGRSPEEPPRVKGQSALGVMNHTLPLNNCIWATFCVLFLQFNFIYKASVTIKLVFRSRNPEQP